MIKFAKGKQPNIHGTSRVKKGTLGSTSAGKKPKSGFVSESSMSPTGMQNTSLASMPLSLDTTPLLTNFAPRQENETFYRLYRDMYYYEPVCGSAADLMSMLPFSDFTLGGIQDAKILQKYSEVLERLSLKSMLPEVSIDYLVLGAHCSSLLYDSSKKVFIDTMPYAIENLTITTLPFYSIDPIVEVKFPQEILSILNKKSTRMEEIRSLVGNSVFEKIQQGKLELDPLSTIYIPRKTFSTTDSGSSYFRRVLPIYLIEKNLYRGTLVESGRRQRGILHLTLGDGDTWEPTVQDLEFMTELFMNADADPLGAIIATRQGVDVNEFRQGGDFWKVSDFTDSALAHKLRALGISEAFLSGDANWNTADTSLTVFLDMIRSYRSMLTRKLFYDKLFPLIALLNGFTINTRGKIVVRTELSNKLSPAQAQHALNDGSKLFIPSISWEKSLKAEGDTQYMEMLSTMSEKGVPIPLRIMAAAGGLNLEDLLRQQDEDLDLRKRIADYQKLISKLAPQEEGDEEGTASSLSSLASESPARRTKSAVYAERGKVPILDRDFGNDAEVTGTTKTGKAKLIIDQKAANEKANRSIVKALRNENTRRKISSQSVSLLRKHKP